MFKNVSKFLILASVIILNACVGGGGGSSNKSSAQKTSPTVSLISPTNNESNVSRTPLVQLQFSEAMKIATLTNANIKLQTAAGLDVSISAITPGAGNEITFSPINPLVTNTVYKIVITAGVLSLSGNPVVPQTFTFTTGAVIAPTVALISPANAESNISRTPLIKLDFSEAMNLATLTNATIKLQTATGSDVSISAITPGVGNEVTFSPLNSLAASTVYKIVITTGILDLNGNSVAPQTFTFTTGAIIAPTVTMISPADAELNVTTRPLIQLQFSEPMDLTTVTNANIKLRDTSGVDIAIGAITQGLLNKFSFSPANLLVTGATYQIVVTAGVLDVNGNSVAPQSFTFTTADRGFIYKTSPNNFKVDLARFKVLSTSNNDLANEIKTRFPYRSLGTVANLNQFNSMNMFRMRGFGFTNIHEVLNVENAAGSEYATISYPGTTIVTNSFEVDKQPFSKLYFLDEYSMPMQYANFKNAHSLTDLQMQKLIFAIVASGIGGSPVYEISLSPGSNSDELDINLTGGVSINMASYSPNVRTTYLSSPYNILPGDYNSVEVKFRDDMSMSASESIILNNVMKFIQSNNDIPSAITNHLLPTNNKDQLMFIGMILKLSGNHYLGSSSFGAIDSPDLRGPLVITQLRAQEIFSGLAAALAGTLDHDVYNDLFVNPNLTDCIDMLGGQVMSEARRLP